MIERCIVSHGPFDWIDARHQRRLAWLLTAATLLLSLALMALGGPLATREAPHGIVSFEFAGDAVGAARVLGSWSAAARERAMLIQGLDFLYLLIYSAWLSLLCWLVAARLRGAPARLGRALAWAALAAGAFDAVENAALIQLLLAGPADAPARLAAICAVAKFALVLLAAGYALAGWLAGRAGAGRGAAPPSGP